MSRILPSLALATCLSGCAGDRTEPGGPSSLALPTPTPAMSTVAGTVTSTTGDLIAGATVSVTNAATPSNATTTAKTDGSGRYALSGLRAAEYSISAEASGYAATSRAVSLSG